MASEEARALHEAVNRLTGLWDSSIVPSLEVAFEPESVIQRSQAAFDDVRAAERRINAL
jgi:hypothetical protein